MNYANYGKRAVAYLIDLLYVIVPGMAAAIISIGFFIPDATRGIGIGLLVVAGLWWLFAGLYNTVVRQGQSGQTVGKGQQKISLIREDTGQPVGVGIALVRLLASWFFNAITGGIYLIVDLLAPAFTEKKQRITDKLLSTVVIDSEFSTPTKRGGSPSWPPPGDDLPK
jgi:uncharacterized RDD family membrane protein YckC